MKTFDQLSEVLISDLLDGEDKLMDESTAAEVEGEEATTEDEHTHWDVEIHNLPDMLYQFYVEEAARIGISFDDMLKVALYKYASQ